MKHFDQLFHKSRKPIVHEKTDLVYDSYGLDSKPSFWEHISTSTSIGAHRFELVYDYYKLEFEEGIECFCQEQILIQVFKGNGNNPQSLSISLSEF